MKLIINVLNIEGKKCTIKVKTCNKDEYIKYNTVIQQCGVRLPSSRCCMSVSLPEGSVFSGSAPSSRGSSWLILSCCDVRLHSEVSLGSVQVVGLK